MTEDVLLNVNISAEEALATYQKLQDRIKELRLEQEKQIKLSKGQGEAAKTAADQSKVLEQQIKALTSRSRDYERQIQNTIKSENSQATSLEQMRAELSRLTQKYNQLTDAQRKADLQMAKDKNVRSYTLRIKELTKQIAQAEQQIGNFRRNVGNYTSAFGKFTGAIGNAFTAMLGPAALAYKAISGIISAFKNLIVTNKDFEQANANLASILGTTRDNIKDLTTEAKRLGETTVFTASEVTKLQTELAKLGFTTKEIKDSQAAILQFAQATDAELPEAAAAAGSAMRAFGMEANEMNRIVSTLAVSTTKSALTFDKLATAMPIIAPVAKAANLEIEDTVTLLGKLSDAGFDATMAATATRNILLNLANSSGKLAKTLGRPIHSIEELAPALKELKDRGISLAEAFDLTDKRSVAAFNTLIEQSGGLEDLKKSITGVDEELRKMVEERMNTLQGSTTQMKSAWEGLMLSFSNSNGFFKDVVDWVTKVIRKLTELKRKVSESTYKEVEDTRTERGEKIQGRWNTEADQKIYEISKAKDKDAKETEVLQEYTDELAKNNRKRAEIEKKLNELTNVADTGKTGLIEKKGITAYAVGQYYGMTKNLDDLDKASQRLTSDIEKEKNKLIDVLVEIDRANYVIGKITESTAAKTTTSDYDKDADKKSKAAQRKAEQERQKAEREWQTKLQQMYSMLKKTEEEGAEEIGRRYDLAIATAQEAYEKINSKKNKTDEDKEELFKYEAYKKALEMQKQKDMDDFNEKSIMKRIKKAEELIKAGNAEELKSFFSTEEEKNDILIKQTEQRISMYQEEMDADLKITEDTRKKIQAKITDAQNEMLELQQKKLVLALTNNLLDTTLTAEKKYNLRKKELEEELKLVKGNSQKESEIKKKLYDLEKSYIHESSSLELENVKLTQKDRYKIKKEELEKELELIKGNADEENRINNELKTLRQQYAKAVVDSVQQYVDAAMSITSTIASAQKEREDQELEEYQERQEKAQDALQERLDKGLITQEQYDKRKAEMDAQVAQKEKELEIKQAKRDKAIALMTAILETAMGIAKAVAESPWTGGLPASAIVAATGAAQIATIAAQKIPTAGRGMMIDGPSHANGGVLINAEGGEAIINKKATAKYAPLLSAINQSTGGVPIFGAGGVAGVNLGKAAMENVIDYGKLAIACSKMNIQVAVTDINKGQANMVKVQQRKTY